MCSPCFDECTNEGCVIGSADRVRMLLAEAGYPDAHVYVENGIFVEDAPDDVAERAFQIVNAGRSL